MKSAVCCVLVLLATVALIRTNGRSWDYDVVLAENTTNSTGSVATEPWAFPDYPVTESEWQQWEISHGMPKECEPEEEVTRAPDGTQVKTYYADCSKRASGKSTLAAVSQRQRRESSLNRLKIKHAQDGIRNASPQHVSVVKSKVALHKVLAKKLHQTSRAGGKQSGKFDAATFNQKVKEEGRSMLAKDEALAAKLIGSDPTYTPPKSSPQKLKGKFSKASGAAAQVLQLMKQSGNFVVPSIGYVGPKL